MSRVNYQKVANRLTRDRLASYLNATGGSLGYAIDLYDWNTLAGGALHEDLGRLEVVFRNAIDNALIRHGRDQGWQTTWYRRTELFPGQLASRARVDVDRARQRATQGGRHPEVHGKVIAELGFGFWRYLCEPPYHTSLWVPALTAAFPLHPSTPNTRRVRAEVADRMQRLHFLRNRIAHHEPIHRRDLARDHAQLLEVVGWICSDSRTWVAARSRTPSVLAARP
ncbi:MAG: hypothetical protein OXK16_09455 [bacterium]|nr:hypothetical protein [bacterium]